MTSQNADHIIEAEQSRSSISSIPSPSAALNALLPEATIPHPPDVDEPDSVQRVIPPVSRASSSSSLPLDRAVTRRSEGFGTVPSQRNAGMPRATSFGAIDLTAFIRQELGEEAAAADPEGEGAAKTPYGVEHDDSMPMTPSFAGRTPQTPTLALAASSPKQVVSVVSAATGAVAVVLPAGDQEAGGEEEFSDDGTTV